MMFARAILAAAAAQASVAGDLPAGPETVEQFLTEADAVLASGEAPEPSRVEGVRNAVQQAAAAYRAALANAEARGEPPTSCPPPAGQAQLSLGELIADFRAIPQANRSMPVTTAFALVMTLRFPCAPLAP